MATVEERNAELTKQLSLLKERNKQLGNIVDVEKDIVIKSKEIQTAADGVKQQYESVRESVFSGIESFTTGMFGGPIGGLINTLTIGSLKRRKENAKIEKEKDTKEYKWLYDLLELLENSSSQDELIENSKIRLFQDNIYIFSPKGDVMELPKNATSVDFAYSIHSEIGDKCVATKINGKLQPLKAKLKKGLS